VRNVLVVILALGSGLACTSHDSAPAVAEEPPPLVVEPPQGEPPPPEEPEPQCPPGTERHERGGEEPDALDWWCARDGVRHGPFFRSDFDLRRRTWYGVHGEHVDGELHGPVDSEGSYDVVEYGRLRVFRREVYDHGRLLRSNEAHARVALGAAAPTVTRRFAVEASGLTPTAGRQGAPAAIGTFDVEVASAWGDAPAGAPPSVLRVELSLSPTDAPDARRCPAPPRRRPRPAPDRLATAVRPRAHRLRPLARLRHRRVLLAYLGEAERGDVRYVPERFEVRHVPDRVDYLEMQDST
jgi:hypothetical protein